jgi:hypothetical protein
MPAVSDSDDASGVPFGDISESIAGALFEPVQAAFVSAMSGSCGPVGIGQGSPRRAETNHSDPHKSVNAVTRRDNRAEIYCAFR